MAKRCTTDPGPSRRAVYVTVHASRVHPTCTHLSGTPLESVLAAGPDPIRRHMLLLAVGALIGDERQRDKDDRGHQQTGPVIAAGRAFEPIIFRDPEPGKLRRAADLVRQLTPPPVPLCRHIERATNGRDQDRPLDRPYRSSNPTNSTTWRLLPKT
jgi:hypothetical protein